MKKDQLSISDKATATLGSGEPGEQKKYEVVSVNGLTKRGTHYKKGKTITLDTKTANNFILAGDIKEIKA